MNKRVVVDVVANTKPFVASILKLQKLSEALNKKQTKSSINILKNVLKNAQINRKISDFAEKTRKSYKGIEDSTRRTSRHMATIYTSLFAMYRVAKNVVKTGYSTGKDIVDTADVYGVNPKEAEKARALSVVFGGTAEEGTSALGNYLQSRMLFQREQQGPFREAAARLGISPHVFNSPDMLSLLKNLRELRKERNWDDSTVQYALQKIGMGNTPFLQRAITGSEEEFNKALEKMQDQLKLTEDSFTGMRNLQKEWETLLNDVKTQFLQWITPLSQVVAYFNKLPSEIKSVTYALTELAGGLVLLKGSVAILRSVLGAGGAAAGGAAAGGAAAGGSMLGSAALGGAAVLAGLAGLAGLRYYLTAKEMEERQNLFNKSFGEEIRKQRGIETDRDNTSRQVVQNFTFNLNDFPWMGDGSPRTVGEGIANGFINSPEFNMLNRGA